MVVTNANKYIGMIDAINAFNGSRYDVRVTRKDMTIGYEKNGYTMEVADQLFPFNMTPWSLSQLCTQLGIPVPYIKKCPPALSLENLNTWLRLVPQGKVSKLCARGSDVIGIVSKRFVPYSIKDFVDDVLCSTDVEYMIDDYGIDNKCFDCTLRFPSFVIDSDDAPARKIGIGLHLRNSEVGYSSAMVATSIIDHKRNIKIGLASDKYLLCGFKRLIHTKRDHTQFQNGIRSLINGLSSHFRHILNVYLRASEYTITVANIQTLIHDHKLAQNVLDEDIGIEIFGNDTNPTTAYTVKKVIDSIALAASRLNHPHKWDMERVGGEVLAKFADEWGVTL